SREVTAEEREDSTPGRTRGRIQSRHAEKRMTGLRILRDPNADSGIAEAFGIRPALVGQRVELRNHEQSRWKSTHLGADGRQWPRIDFRRHRQLSEQLKGIRIESRTLCEF